MRRIAHSLLIALICVGAATPAYAHDPVEKLGRGLANVATCWIELPKRAAAGRYAENPWIGVSSGLVNGASLTLLRFGVGAYETLTFPFGSTSPYESMELPDYAWE